MYRSTSTTRDVLIARLPMYELSILSVEGQFHLYG